VWCSHIQHVEINQDTLPIASDASLKKAGKKANIR
jgi:hypothetical protein